MQSFFNILKATLRRARSISGFGSKKEPPGDHDWQNPRPEPILQGSFRKDGLVDLVIVDPSLDGFVGHHYEYDFSTARAAMATGHHAAILGNAAAGPDLLAEPAFSAVFRLNMWAKKPDAVNFSEEDLLFCNQSFYGDLLKGLDALQLRKGAVIFAHMITAKQMLAWAWFIERHAQPFGLHVVLLLRYEASVYGGRFAAWAFGVFERHPELVRLASDSRNLAQDYASLTRQPIEVFSIPHAKHATSGGSSDTIASAAGSRVLQFTALGNPRVDKGFLDLLAAIRLVAERGLGAPFQFMLQVNDPGDGVERELAQFRANAPSNTRFIDAAMTPEEYFDAVFAADVVMLPYWTSIYRSRTSGVFVEAVCAEKIVICSDKTWMADELRMHDAGLIVPERDPEALVKAFCLSIEKQVALRLAAKKMAHEYQSRHNAARLVEDIMRR